MCCDRVSVWTTLSMSGYSHSKSKSWVNGFSLMIKNLLEEFAAVGNTSDTTIKISNFSGNHAWFRQLLQEYQKELYGRTFELVTQVGMLLCWQLQICAP